MCRKLIFLACLVFVLGLVGEVFAISWTDNGPDHLWSTSGNWSDSEVPTSGDDALIYYNPDSVEGPVIDATVTAVCNRLKTGYVVAEGDGTVLTVTGGSLDVGDWFGHAENENSVATMNMSGGMVTFDRTMAIGQGGHGVLNMTGGLIRIFGQEEKDGLWVTVLENSTGHIQLDGGRLETRQIFMNIHNAEIPTGSLDITYGVLVVDGSPDTGNWYGFSVQDYVDNGWITAFGGEREVVLEYDAVADKTTVRAFMPEMASNPNPANFGENVCPGATLSWTPGQLCVDDHNVYFGTSLDDVGESAEPYIARHDTNSFTPSLELGTTYYWRVDEVNESEADSPWTGAIWQFTTNDGNAFDLSPADGLRGVSPDLTLEWTPGCLSVSDTVYLGTDFDDVKNGTGGTDKGSQEPGYDPDLQPFTTYYWRIEGVNGNTWPGEVRSFRTGYGGLLMYYSFDNGEGGDIPSPITDDTGKITFTKYTDGGWVRYGESNPIVNAASGTSADFEPNVGLYRLDTGENDLLCLDGYQYTIEMWLKPEVLSDAHGDITLIGKRGSWRIQINDPEPNENDCAYRWTHADNEEQMFDDSAVEGEWAHLAAVYDQTDESEQRMRFYLNGTLQESAEETGLNPADDTNMVTIGMEELADGSFSGFFDGLIDELRVLDVALTPCDFLLVPGPEWASCPSPSDEEEGVDPNGVLSWRPGTDADQHKVFFGESPEEVESMTDPCAIKSLGDESYYPGLLDYSTNYYWRVDEYNEPTTWTGVVWSFRTRSEIEDPNLLLWYKFDETSGDIVRDSSGHDLDGDGDDISDDDWEPNDGHDGGCLSFDGEQRVDVPRDALGGVEKEITATVWVNGGYYTGDNWVFSTGFDPIGDYVVEAAVPTKSGDVSLRAGNDTNDVLVWEEASPSAWRGEWHHFAFVKDENAGTMTIYFDGLPVDEKAGVAADTLVYARYREFKIGARYDQDDGYEGKIDEFRIYDYALSEDEIAALYRGGDLASAWGPSPRDGETDVLRDVVLKWRPGDYAVSHDVYFGTDWDDVNDANTSSDEYKGNQEPNEYNPGGGLALGQTCYWRIDEVNDANIDSPWKGSVWQFTVANFLIIDDFEPYCTGFGCDNDIIYTWIDGFENGTGSEVALGVEPVDPVHGGKQSMEYLYENSDPWHAGTPYYSEMYREFDTAQDWTEAGVKILTLFFYGDADNDANATEQMYAGLEDSRGAISYGQVDYGFYGEDNNDIRESEWHQWDIALPDFTGVILSDISRLYIGFGIRGNPNPGGTPGGNGVIYVDDVRLYPAKCVPWRIKPEADLNNDCIVDLKDVGAIAEEWLKTDACLPVEVPPSGPVGWWKIEAGTGTTVYDYSVVAPSKDGTLTGNKLPTWVTGCPRADPNNWALEFEDGKVLIGDDPKLRPPATLSVCAWVRYSDAPGYSARVVAKGIDAGDNECYAVQVGDDDTMGWFVRDVNNALHSVNSTGKIVHNEWVHLAGTYDGSALKCYINGQLDGSKDDANVVALLQDTNDLAIGNRVDANNRQFEGSVDDVRVYNYGLTAAQVTYIATEGGGYVPLISEVNLYDEEPAGEKAINFRDYAVLMGSWLEVKLWPPEE